MAAYDPSVIATIGSLEQARLGIQVDNFHVFLEEYRVLAVHHHMNNHFGLTLVHRDTDEGPSSRPCLTREERRSRNLEVISEEGDSSRPRSTVPFADMDLFAQ
ncbi:Uu.00g014000.m01.CDS01 [Anthostomella pinea]|uniref:Uu.00g014000.m01.CDS01 n=1 Tax=Anthostomella pinea TaxID=933095 RepID=A0AAI8YQE2_9PEZI|nr:Uu.00g014000.m01.CDS01 [Anthostomella pinea]